MALNGSFSKSFNNSHYRIYVTWSATQDVTNNTSKITLKTYFESDSTWSVYASNLPLKTWIDGSEGKATKSVSTGGGKRILLDTRTKTITHNSDGKKTTTLRVSFDMSGVRVSGGSLGVADTGSKSITLNTIPRKSTLASAKSFTVTNPYSLSINRASSSFVHRLFIKNGSDTIKRLDFSGASTTINFSVAENQKMLGILGSASEKTIQFQLETWTSGYGSMIGMNAYDIRIFMPTKPSLSNNGASFNIGTNITFDLDTYRAEYTTNVTYSFAGVSGTIASGIKEGSFSWNTDAIKGQLLGAIPSNSSATCTVTATSYYNGTKVGQSTTINITLRASGVAPTFNLNSITGYDTNQTTINITGNRNYIIQGKSIVELNMPSNSLATPQGGASIVKYIAEYGSMSKESTNLSAQTFRFSGANSEADGYAYITAVDSRGLSATVAVPLSVIPYALPTLTVKGQRDNGFDNPSTVKSTINFSPITVSGANKNGISFFRYRAIDLTTTSVPDWTQGSVTLTTTGRAENTTKFNLDNSKPWKIEVEVADKINGTVKSTIIIDKGVPIFAMDLDRSSVGIGKLPEGTKTLESAYPILAPGVNVECKKGRSGEVTIDYDSALNIMNFFPSKGVPTKYQFNWGNLIADMFTVKGLDAMQVEEYAGRKLLRMGTEILGIWGDKLLWSGAEYPSDVATITPALPIDKCPTGWLLIWSDGNGDNTNTQHPNPSDTNNWNCVVTPIPKEAIMSSGLAQGTGWLIGVGNDMNTANEQTRSVQKYLYIGRDKITGHKNNGSHSQTRDVVLRAVVAY